MRVLQIDSWLTFCKLCENHAIGEWIFRGGADSSRLLIPAIGRPGARRSIAGVDLPYDEADAALLLKHFKLRARPLVALADDADELEWLAVGRHHGLPTQFLDWTTSPFVAAFFACQPGGVVNAQHVTAAIYATKLPALVAS